LNSTEGRHGETSLTGLQLLEVASNRPTNEAIRLIQGARGAVSGIITSLDHDHPHACRPGTLVGTLQQCPSHAHPLPRGVDHNQVDLTHRILRVESCTYPSHGFILENGNIHVLRFEIQHGRQFGILPHLPPIRIEGVVDETGHIRCHPRKYGNPGAEGAIQSISSVPDAIRGDVESFAAQTVAKGSMESMGPVFLRSTSSS